MSNICDLLEQSNKWRVLKNNYYSTARTDIRDLADQIERDFVQGRNLNMIVHSPYDPRFFDLIQSAINTTDKVAESKAEQNIPVQAMGYGGKVDPLQISPHAKSFSILREEICLSTMITECLVVGGGKL